VWQGPQAEAQEVRGAASAREAAREGRSVSSGRASCGASRRLACVCLLALAVAWAAPVAALAKGVLPKGFAYAAEIKAVVEYEGTYRRETTADVPCTEGEEALTADLPESEEYVLHRAVTFPHITVPVVSGAELGRAKRRLEIPATVTTPGRASDEYSRYSMFGAVFVDAERSCQEEHYECTGVIQNVGGLSYVSQSNDDGLDPRQVELDVEGVQRATPNTCATPDGGMLFQNVMASLDLDAATATPSVDVARGFGLVDLQSTFRRYLYELRDRGTVEFREPVEGDLSCAAPGVGCSQAESGEARVSLHRLFLYRTRRAYRR
jgi:hypothetical protein